MQEGTYRWYERGCRKVLTDSMNGDAGAGDDTELVVSSTFALVTITPNWSTHTVITTPVVREGLYNTVQICSLVIMRQSSTLYQQSTPRDVITTPRDVITTPRDVITTPRDVIRRLLSTSFWLKYLSHLPSKQKEKV